MKQKTKRKFEYLRIFSVFDFEFCSKFKDICNIIFTFNNILVTPQAKKGLFIGLFLMFLNQFSGSFAIMVYTADIFRKSGSDLSPNESSIIVAVIQLIGVYVSTICVEKCGRKVCSLSIQKPLKTIFKNIFLDSHDNFLHWICIVFSCLIIIYTLQKCRR